MIIIKISANEFDKLSNYKDMEMKITRVRDLNAKSIPLEVKMLRMIKKNTDRHVKKIPGNPSLFDVQQFVLIITAHIYRKTL